MKKDFDKLSVKQLKHIHSIFHQQQLDNEEISDLIKSHNDILNVLSKAPPWAHFYELPYITFLALCILMFELTDAIHSVANASDQAQAFIDYIDNMPDVEKDEELSEEDKGFGFSLVMAINKQQASIAIFNEPLSQLVERVKEGDDEALFNAVLVDRSIISAPSIAHRIQKAVLLEDESFMDSLSRAIKKSRPRRPAKKYDDLRYMIKIIDEEIGLDNVDDEKLYNLLFHNLQLYDSSPDGLERLIRRIKERSRT